MAKSSMKASLTTLCTKSLPNCRTLGTDARLNMDEMNEDEIMIEILNTVENKPALRCSENQNRILRACRAGPQLLN